MEHHTTRHPLHTLCASRMNSDIESLESHPLPDDVFPSWYDVDSLNLVQSALDHCDRLFKPRSQCATPVDPSSTLLSEMEDLYARDQLWSTEQGDCSGAYNPIGESCERDGQLHMHNTTFRTDSMFSSSGDTWVHVPETVHESTSIRSPRTQLNQDQEGNSSVDSKKEKERPIRRSKILKLLDDERHQCILKSLLEQGKNDKQIYGLVKESFGLRCTLGWFSSSLRSHGAFEGYLKRRTLKQRLNQSLLLNFLAQGKTCSQIAAETGSRAYNVRTMWNRLTTSEQAPYHHLFDDPPKAELAHDTSFAGGILQSDRQKPGVDDGNQSGDH